MRLGIRPESICIGARAKGRAEATVGGLVYLGADSFAIVHARPVGQMTIRCHGEETVAPGHPIGLKFRGDRQHSFDGKRLAIRRR